MASAPQISFPDGTTFGQFLTFTTNKSFVVLEGTVDPGTVAVQVSINSGGFSSDPTLIDLNNTSFSFPASSSYPDGFALSVGVTKLEFRAIDMVGAVSPTSVVEVTRVAYIMNAEAFVPTGISIRRRRGDIDILVSKPDTNTEVIFKGFNFYASTSPGGTTGYLKVNESLVTEQSSVFSEDLLDWDSNEVVFSPDDTRLRIRLTLEDVFDNETGLVLDRVVAIGSVAQQLKFSQIVQIRTLDEYIFFRHDRRGGPGIINSDQFLDVNDSEPLYYVVTAVHYDPSTNEEFETSYSQEVLGQPIILDTALKDLPGRTQSDVRFDYIALIQRVNEEISLLPGSTTRDVSIDPFSSEAERVWFIADFVHRSQSVITLLQIDDANRDGVSDPVASSAYKVALKAALGLQSDDAVQNLIDTQFEKLAANKDISRLPGRPAIGQAVYYSTSKPTKDVVVSSGSIVSANADTEAGLPASRFVVGGTYIMPVASAQAYYNYNTQRYELIADIVAETLGSDGNRPTGSIKNALTAVGGFQVTNTEATVLGTDQESNNDLAVRTINAFTSVDSGTEGGYGATIAKQIGILKAKTVKSGDALMMRDYDEVRKKHIGGKVDCWIQGVRERTVSDRFAFSFEVARDIRCQIIDPVNLIFRVIDNRVTLSTPLMELLDNPSQGLGMRNASSGLDYDLAGVAILDYNTFQLSTLIAQPTTALDDVVLCDYRFRLAPEHIFSLQPVQRVISVTGEVSGTLDSTLGYSFYKIEDPLLEGESTLANDYLKINQVGGIPAGASILINDEQHVMIGFFEERLQSIGINTATIRVFDETRVTEYGGPGSSSPDFDIIEGTSVEPAKIVRTASSTIVSGQTVSVDYEHDENFTVTYVINDLLQQLQRKLNAQRHITADVICKQTVQNAIDLETTIQLKAGATKDSTDPKVRTAVSIELNQKLIGQGSAQSDLINAIDSTDGVDFQVLPLAKMAWAEGSRKIRESVLSSAARISSLDIGGSSVFILTNPLKAPTTDGGGLETEHKGVFQDDLAMTLAGSWSIVGKALNQAYIIGSGGAILVGYSDDATISAAIGSTDPDDILAERLRRTANHILLSLSSAGDPPDAPEMHKYAVSYVIRGDRGPRDITASSVESIELGDLDLTFRSADLGS